MNQRLMDRYNQIQADQTKFMPDDILIHTYEGIEQEVNFRGPYKGDAVVVFPSGMQLTVPFDRLRAKPKRPQELIYCAEYGVIQKESGEWPDFEQDHHLETIEEARTWLAENNISAKLTYKI